MVNLQLLDSLSGGYFVFQRNDYILDEGIYTELYCALFGTSSPDWLLDSAFETQSEKIASRTENALKTHNTNTDTDISLIKKAVLDDLERFTTKNKKILIEDVAILLYSNNAIRIVIELTGNTEAFNFIYSKTKQSLDNISYKIY